jgi:5-(carboxyamino)imidazole ribonucleotide synthase
MNKVGSDKLNSRIGMLGGGQLGRMFIQEALNLNAEVHVLDPDPYAPCRNIAESFTVGSLNDTSTVLDFGRDKDILTVEIENVSIEALEELEKAGKRVFPQPFALRTIKDKGIQKQFYDSNGIPTSSFKLIASKSDITEKDLPCVQKLRTGGYDGKGVQVLKTAADLERAFDAPSVLEELIDFEKEISVIVARSPSLDLVSYPVVECEFNAEANLVELLFSPAEISEELEQKARLLALEVIEKLGMIGILAVELFVTRSGEILVNEIAPRPHNSGHHTIECNVTSQFEQHLRSILDLPLGSTRMISPGAMINLLGEKGYEGEVHFAGLEDALKQDGVFPHLYGKKITKPFRKMGHITVTGSKMSDIKSKAKKLIESVKAITN